MAEKNCLKRMKETQVKKTRFNVWAWHNLPPCKVIVKWITAAEDGRLSLYKTIVMKIHLFSCRPCVNFLKQLKFLRRAMHECGDNLAPPENEDAKLSDAARERLKNAIKSSATAF